MKFPEGVVVIIIEDRYKTVLWGGGGVWCKGGTAQVRTSENAKTAAR
jgi:hypothetical protein